MNMIQDSIMKAVQFVFCVMFERLAKNGRAFEARTKEHLHDYADAGLRTLVLAYHELSQEVYEVFNKEFNEAKNSVGADIEEMIDQVAEKIEKDLILLSVTSIEDKIQNGVPEYIDKLAQVGIKIWVLTGDKNMETAINIRFACSLLGQGMEQIIFTLETPEILALAKEGNKKKPFLSLKSKILVWPDGQLITLSCFGGAYSLIPYFVLWKPPHPPVEEDEITKWTLSFLESKITMVISLTVGLGLITYAGLANADAWKEFYQSFRESKFIHATCVDFSLLLAFASFWFYNDMTARNW